MNSSESSNTSSTISIASSISICSTSKTTNEATPKKQRVAKTVRDEFFRNVIKNEKNWSATCLICDEIILDNIGVTSNVNRHMKNYHQTAYIEWLNKLNELDRQQPKILNFVSKKNLLPSSSKQVYPAGHRRQQELHDAIVQDLIIELGLPLSLVERPEFIKFMSTVDSKFTVTKLVNGH
jgi:hypothetical protein